ncbi:Purple acid phosphatase 22 [Acorus gramineus]|uniref:Purple acid phosphatase 22 n=1 Tax=Acorus gramineus TaxID=55184 RepID=A0AAV9BKF6_ACOGR|nr:Purple acid phosphatase 22 [Acorus gramineus]
MVTQGNHEVESLPLGRPFVSYNARWLMPHAESASASNLYYSFDVADGAVHVVMLGSYADFGPGSDQRRWLESDLARVDRRHVGWVVAVVHAPWYSTNVAHDGEGEGMREALESLLYDARVDVVFAGHVHAYERFGRVYNNSPDGCGPVHITVGDGGNREGLSLMFKETSSPMSVFREASFGHGRLRVYNATHARWSWHRNDDSDSTVRDEVWLTSLGSSTGCGPRPCPANDEL